MNRIKILFIITFLSLTSCSTEKDQVANPKESKEQSAAPSEPSKTKQVITEKSKIPDIMMPLDGADPCFEAVELIREPNDVNTYRDLGDSILLADDEPARDDHRTYIGIIGAMLKKDRTIAEIRQAILDTCRTLKKVAHKQD